MQDKYWEELDEVVYMALCELTKLSMQTDSLKSRYKFICNLWEAQYKGTDLYCELSEYDEYIECFTKRVDAQLEASKHLKKLYAKLLESYDVEIQKEIKTLAKYISFATRGLEREIAWRYEKLNNVTLKFVDEDEKHRDNF